MKNKKVVLSIIMMLTLSSVEAGGLDFFLDSIVEEVESQTKKKKEKKHVRKKKEPVAATNIVESFYGESKDVQDYEGALRPGDLICAQIVEPFSLTDNATGLIKGLASDTGSNILKSFLDTEYKTPSKESLLKTAKLKAKQLNWMPMDQEIQYGLTLHNDRLKKDKNLFKRSKKGRVKRVYAKADEILNRVLSQVKEEHPYEFRVFLVNNDDINAEALPGGYLYLNTGVLDSEYAELVVAHEISHVLKRHQTRETQAMLIDSVETYEDLKALLKNGKPSAAQIAKRGALLHGLFLNYSRQQELQADACSIRLVQKIPGMNIDKKIEPYVASLSADVLPDKKRERKSAHPTYPERSKRMKVIARRGAAHK